MILSSSVWAVWIAAVVPPWVMPPATAQRGLNPTLPQVREVEPPGADVLNTTLTELCDRPLDFLGREIRFTLQFDGPLESWNPYLTRFDPGQFAAYSAWGDAQLLWDQASFESPSPQLFARRRGAPARTLAAAERYQRFAVHARVVEVFIGKPWIEIVDAVRQEEQVTEGCILHASRATWLMQVQEWRLALEDLSRAKASKLPLHARHELERMEAACRAEVPDPEPEPER